MPPEGPPKQRLLRLLRRTAKGARAVGERSTADESALWSSHERALTRTRDAGAAGQHIASSVARQRAAIEAVGDRSRAVSSRVSEVQTGLSRVVDALDRLGLVALNAGLEGARLGESEGRSLALVGDEVRAQSSRGAEAGREIVTLLAQLSSDLVQLEGLSTQAQATVAEVAQDAARTVSAASDAESALVDVGNRVKRATGSDPETVRAVAEASERARALVTSLSALTGKVPRASLVGALAPVLAPLARLLTDDDGDDDERDKGG